MTNGHIIKKSVRQVINSINNKMLYLEEHKKSATLLIRPLLKKYNLKGTFSITGNYSTLNLNIKSGELDFLGEYNNYKLKRQIRDYEGHLPFYPADDLVILSSTGNHRIEKFSSEIKEFLKKVLEILGKGNYVNIGSSYKPYKLTK